MTSHREKISIIIPVYNVEPYLERCVRSVLDQSFRDFEIILVNDGSTDRSPEICRRLASLDGRIKVFDQVNGGLSDARNTGIREASGEYIAFIDSDDWVRQDFLNELQRNLEESGADIAGCRYIRTCSENELIPDSEVHCRIYDRDEAMEALISNRIEQVVWNKLYRRSAIEGILFEKGKYHEDEFWSYQIFSRIGTYAETDYTGYCYFQRPESIMGAAYSLKRLDAVEAKCRRQKFLEKEIPGHAPSGRINLWSACLYHGQEAVKSLKGRELAYALAFLKKVLHEYPVRWEDLKKVKVTHRAWFLMEKISLERTCRIRNFLGIGV